MSCLHVFHNAFVPTPTHYIRFCSIQVSHRQRHVGCDITPASSHFPSSRALVLSFQLAPKAKAKAKPTARAKAKARYRSLRDSNQKLEHLRDAIARLNNSGSLHDATHTVQKKRQCKISTTSNTRLLAAPKSKVIPTIPKPAESLALDPNSILEAPLNNPYR